MFDESHIIYTISDLQACYDRLPACLAQRRSNVSTTIRASVIEQEDGSSLFFHRNDVASGNPGDGEKVKSKADIALSKPPRERSDAEKKLLGSMSFW